MEQRPIAPATWEKLPPEVQAYILVLENALRQSLDRIAQLEQKVNELESELNQSNSASRSDTLMVKLKEALDKIDQQGKLINALSQKLQDCGKTADNTKITGK